jgi:hypothetical protein
MDIISNPIEQVKPMDKAKPTYGFVNTRDLLDTFKQHGWTEYAQKVAQARKPEKVGFTRHAVMLTHPEYVNIPGLTEDNKTKPMLIALNSHDLSSALYLFYGGLRDVCLNLNVFGTVLRSFRAIHSKNIMDKLNYGIEYMTQGIGELNTAVSKLQGIEMSPSQIDTLTQWMIAERLKHTKNIVEVNTRLVSRRHADNYNDAFTVINRIQEYLVRGGIEYKQLVQKDETKFFFGMPLKKTIEVVENKKTRKLSSIPSQIRLNTQLYKNASQILGINLV